MTQRREKYYEVYFRQVNQVCIDVSAVTPGHAIRKAIRVWRKENAAPVVIDCQEVPTDDEMEP